MGASVANAGIVFELVPAQPTIPTGGVGQFDIFFTPDTNVSIGGYTVGVVSEVGNFSSGTFDLVIAAGQAWDVSSSPGEAFSTFDGLGTTVAVVANQRRLFGSLLLDTAGVPNGEYNMFLSEVNLIDGFGNDLGATISGSAGSITFSISTIPEPTSIALVCIAGIGALARGRRRPASVLG
jgi:hypothetical protein